MSKPLPSLREFIAQLSNIGGGAGFQMVTAFSYPMQPEVDLVIDHASLEVEVRPIPIQAAHHFPSRNAEKVLIADLSCLELPVSYQTENAKSLLQ